MPKPLVIVESPAKARTIGAILGRDYTVESSVGHIRDLPRNASEVPVAHKEDQWARMGVNVNDDFKPLYIVTPDKKRTVQKLKELLKDASELYLATDEDREGESIAWHLSEVLSPRVPVKRMVFHEITKPAILRAVETPRDIDRRLVDAQEARRILDRLFGYEVSPVLWKKVMPGLSAGRVQSVATRMLVERERARMRFRRASYWGIDATFETDEGSFVATLVVVDGKRLVAGKDFDEAGALKAANAELLDEAGARALASSLTGAPFAVRSVEEKPWKQSPRAPFMTSTLQQESSRKLRFSVHRTMQIAQRLYENGYITYMRTDSVTLSETAVAAARAQAAEMFGPETVAATPRAWRSKVKNAQEAHEAIRPAGDSFRTPAEVQDELNGDEFRLYDLIWKRTVASEMADATGKTVQVRVGASAGGRDAEFAASGKVIEFYGFMKAYVEGEDDPDAALDDQQTILPPLAEGDGVRAAGLEAKGHETQPPARYTEATLVKALEDLGVGRPSTYASILDTIEDRGYVWKRGTALIPSWIAFAVVVLLEQHFTHLVEYEFTAKMEDELDEIAGGNHDAVPYLRTFYFGNGQAGLKAMVSERLGEIDAREINSIPIGRDEAGKDIVLRVGRYGPYIQRGEERASVPEDLAPDELTLERAQELLAQPSQERRLGEDPATGLPILAKAGRYGPYVQLGEPEPDSKERPKTASLFQTMSLETITVEDALRLLSLPRVVSVEPDGEEIVAQNGRYGPYIKKGNDTRSLESEEHLLTINPEQARAILAEPKRRRGQRATPQAPLKELGPDPSSGKPIVGKEGRFGPDVTDGETNAALRRGDSVETLTLDRALELLQDRR
ncbi:MAG: type I DNA topoisomerase, partial [Actinobacteria bacterium]|nr:type I DNA topoisomerase [Actinomycetota bacterium]